MIYRLSFFMRYRALSVAVLFFGVLVCVSPPASALTPDEILLLANEKSPQSLDLARYYMRKRAIPGDHLLKLRITDKEQCTRRDYERKIAAPVRTYLNTKQMKGKIRCLLIMYGLPLKIAAPEMNGDERREYRQAREREKDLETRFSALKEGQKKQHEEIEKELARVKKRLRSAAKTDQRASVDSEIALVLQGKYPVSGWILNPFFAGYQDQRLVEKRAATLLVSRLDGPSPLIVRRVIDDSLSAERSGLKGKAYFDARWPFTREKIRFKGKWGYKFYDRSIHMAADLVRKGKVMPVIVNDKPEVFQPGQCPDTALYCGWYSLAHYVDAFTWATGSVGYHIASAECRTLRRSGSQVWCRKMLEKGIAATLGPVNEPYIQAFPLPEFFFRFLLDGYWSLAECYALSKPFLSWQMILIGDPLYRPFKRK